MTAALNLAAVFDGIDAKDIALLPRDRRERLAELLATITRRNSQRQFFDLFPDNDNPQPDGRIIYARSRYPKHIEFFDASARYRETCFLAANRVGKALRNGTPVATPLGWVPIEQLKVGDEVIAGDGTITSVVGVYPQGIKPLYRLTFDVGETIDCCGEHLWKYQHPRARYAYRRSHGRTEDNPFFGEWRTADTAAIIGEVGFAPITRMRVVMPTSRPWQLPAQSVPIDPYLLGVLLGDGTLRGTSVSFSTTDEQMLEMVAAVLPAGLAVKHWSKCSYRIAMVGERKRAANGSFACDHPLLNDLRQIGAFGALAAGKRVPRLYLLNDIPTRLAVLQGLMDTDGSINVNGAMEFSSVSAQLADDVRFLVHSLGGKATIEQRQTYFTHLGERRAGQPSYRVRIRLNLCPFRLLRKATRWRPRHSTADRVLHRIEIAEPGEATCIAVAHPSRLFVTAHGIVTHNTTCGAYAVTAHLTGLYPHWWTGRRFAEPVSVWACGKRNESTRDVVQKALLGDVSFDTPDGRKGFKGTAMIPGHFMGRITWKRGVDDLVDTILVKHVSGGWSRLGLKAYEQGRGSFEGTAKHVIWLDEECPLDVYGECLIRTATTGGIILLTFTPVEGLTETVMQFIRQED